MIIAGRKLRYWYDAVFGRVFGHDNWRLLKSQVHVFLFRKLSLGRHRSDVVYSLTSYADRQDVLRKAVLSILGQSIVPEVIQVVLTESDWSQFSIRNRDFLINNCNVKLVKEDYRSFKKLIYTLQEFPAHRVVTFDDDLYYEYDAVEVLLKHERLGDTVLCRRAHEIRLEDNIPLMYAEWDFEVVRDVKSRLVFPTSGGVMMVLPGALNNTVLDHTIFMTEADGADDMWWYFMFRIDGGVARKCGGQMRLYEWSREDKSGLFEVNHDGRNDIVFQTLQARLKLDFGVFDSEDNDN